MSTTTPRRLTGDATVPLLAPSPALLRAGAIWVEVANWADAFERRFGAAQIIAGSERLDAATVRSSLTGRERSPEARPPRWRTSTAATVAETFVKDLRWLRHGLLAPPPLPQLPPRAGPLVWQHHDLFHVRGRRLADDLGVPLVQFVDAPQVWEARKWGVRRPGWATLAARCGDGIPLRQADVVAVVSEDVRDAVIELGVHESRVVTTPTTAEWQEFDPGRRQLTRQQLEIDHRMAIGWIGSFRPFHALDLLVDAFVAAQTTCPSLHLVLIGDGPERSAVAERLEVAGISSRVTFTGAVPHTRVPQLLEALDLAILPARSADGFHYSPLKAREYLASGRPLVAADVGDMRDLVLSSGAGWIVEPGSVQALADRILAVADDDIERNQRSEAAQTYARDELGTDAQVAKVLDRLASLGFAP